MRDGRVMIYAEGRGDGEKVGRWTEVDRGDDEMNVE